jgi:hypothetical protein
MENFHIQLIGYISIVFHFLAFYEQKEQKKFLIFNILSILFLTTHFYFLNAFNAVFIMGISFFINVFSFLTLKISKNKIIKNLKTFIILLTPLLGVINFYHINNGIYGILPAIASIFSATAVLQTDLLKSKIIIFGSLICWFIYSVIINSIPGILYDIVGFVALTYSLKIMLNEKKSIKNQKEKI